MNDIRVICFGEILWDNLTGGRQLGGAPLNVCYHAMKMGANSTILTQVGDDQNGRDILASLESLGVDARYCLVQPGVPTSTVEVITSNTDQVTYDIVENVAWDFIEVTPAMEKLVEEADALVFGSLITRSEVSRKSLFRLIEKSRFRVFDVNLRAPFYSKEIIIALLEKANLLKLNEDELVVISQWIGIDESTSEDQLQGILSNFPGIKEIILTLGAKGAMYYSATCRHSVIANKIRVRDTVGSGDSFLAAFITGYLQGEPVKKALDQANLLSGFVASKQGACPVYNKEDLAGFKKSLELIKQK